MDYSRIITEFLGIQDVMIEDVKKFKKDLRVEIKIRQKRSECLNPIEDLFLWPEMQIYQNLK